MDREGFRNRLKQYKKAREENPGLKYYDFMERLAEFKANEWNDDPDIVLQHMLNDNSYNYQQMYEDNPNFDIQEGHFVDTYKTAYHPTFSEESIYSGKKSPYNPEGIIGGSWDESTKSFYLNDKRQSKQKAQDYLNHADPGYRAIPRYDEGTNFVTYDPDELQRNIQRVLHTTPEGEVNPFYNSLDDTYGSVELPEITVTAPYTRKASLAQQARLGREAYYKAGQKAAPVLAAIPLGAGILGAASIFGFGPVLDIIDVASDPTNPLSYIDKFDLSKIKKVDPMSKNAKPVSDKIFVDDTKVAGSTTTKPTYLDYGTVSFEDDFLNERPLWVKDAQEFYDTDVMTRERNAASTAGIFYNLPFAEKRSKLTFNSKRPVYVREYLDNVDFGGYANKDMVVIDKNSPFSPDEVLVHEGAHLDQYNGKELPFDLMADFDIRETISNFVTNTYNDPKYKSFLLEKLDDAYEFTESFGNIHSTLEKGAINREMRYNLWLKNNKPNVNELDNIIDKMSDDDIIYMLTQTNSYSRDVHKNLLEKGKNKKEVAARIRTALKTVPMLSAPIILNSTNDDLVSFADGGEVGDNKAIPTQEEYIAEQIAAKKATALSNFRSATEPVLPIINGQPNVNSCIYTALNMYGRQYATPGNWTFYDDPGKHGFKQKELSKALPSDLIQVFDKNKPYHMMMLDGYDEQGHPLYNYSRGMKGDSSDIVKTKTNFPNTKKLAYEFVGTPADSTQWKNEYKKLYGYVDGGEVEGDFLKLFGNLVSYKPLETSWWSDIKNWWNDATGMKNYAYGNCATTPSGKHTKECAHYSNSVLRGQGYKNIVGDAWTRAAHSGMKKIISGYDGLTKPAKWDEDDAHEYLLAAAKNFTNKVDTMSLNPYDVIGLYYPDSPNTKKAFELGKWGETQTHTGHIAIGKDGTHYVVHNVDGHLKMNKLADMITGDYEYLPVSAYRPKK